MRTVNYEWDIEDVDRESGDILDHFHHDRLSEVGKLEPHQDLVLVRDVWDVEEESLKDRTHWYPLDDPDPVFSNGIDVPKRYIKEFEKWRANR